MIDSVNPEIDTAPSTEISKPISALKQPVQITKDAKIAEALERAPDYSDAIHELALGNGGEKPESTTGKADASTDYSEAITELSSSEIKKFKEAIAQSEITGLPTEFDEKAVAQAMQQLQETGILIIGETHGVKENPDIIYSLMKKLGCHGLALEWDRSLTLYIEDYLQTGVLTINQVMEFQIDGGMITAGHFALLQRLKNEGMLSRLILFDEALSLEADEVGKGAEVRDANMASNLKMNLDRSIPTLVISGSIHANTEETDADGDSKAKKPMGAHLKEDYPSFHTGRIHYQKGSYHNNGDRQFEIDSVIAEMPSFSLDTNGNYIYNLPEAHSAIVLN